MARLTAEERQRAGQAVQDRRADLGFTQQELTQLAHVASDRVGVVERAEEWPQTRTRKAIEDALQLKRGALLRIARGSALQDEVLDSPTTTRVSADADDDLRMRIRALINECEDFLLSGQVEWAETAFRRATSVARQLTDVADLRSRDAMPDTEAETERHEQVPRTDLMDEAAAKLHTNEEAAAEDSQSTKRRAV